VRSLAQRSSAAAKEIKELIDTRSSACSPARRWSTTRVRTMTEIIGAVQRVTDIMGEIARRPASRAVVSIRWRARSRRWTRVTQQNAALVEEAAAAAQSLEDQAARLRQAVSVFQLDETGQGQGHEPQRAAAQTAPKGPCGLRWRHDRRW